MKVYKLTDENDRSLHGDCQWGEGITHEAPGGEGICNKNWMHSYQSPLLAVIMNPIHANYNLSTAHLWEAEAEGELQITPQKVASTRVTTLRRIEKKEVTEAQKRRFAYLCADKAVREIAPLVLDKVGLTDSANTLRKLDPVVDKKTARAAAAYAADAAAYAAARAAAYAADAADAAAYAAADATIELDLAALAEQACKEE